MGILMTFYSGDADEIGKAFDRSDSKALRDRSVVTTSSDFSIHILPDDLDSLTIEACRIQERPEIAFISSMGRNVGGDPMGPSAVGSVNVMSEGWVDLFASIPDEVIEPLVSARLARWAEDNDENPPEDISAPLQCTQELIYLCKTAKMKNKPVVHAWGL